MNIVSRDRIDLGSKAGPGSVQAFAGISVQAGNQINFNSRKISLQGLKSATTSLSHPSDGLSTADDRFADPYTDTSALQVRSKIPTRITSLLGEESLTLVRDI